MRPTLLITGASRGIGKATALAFARAGYDIAITARTAVEGQRHPHALTGADGQPLPGSLATTAQEIRACGARALPLRMDLLEGASIDAAVRAVLGEFGRIDVLINNAIYQGADLNARFLDLTEEVLARVWQGYVGGPFRLTRPVVTQMLAQGGGTVINVSSGAGATDPPLAAGEGGWGFAYGAGKTALITGGSRGIGQAIAELFARQGAEVVICSRKQQAVDEVAAAMRLAGGKAHAIVAHVGKLFALRHAPAMATIKHGRYLANCWHPRLSFASNMTGGARPRADIAAPKN